MVIFEVVSKGKVEYVAFGSFVSLTIEPAHGGLKIHIYTGDSDISKTYFTQEPVEEIWRKIRNGEIITVKDYEDVLRELRQKVIESAKNY